MLIVRIGKNLSPQNICLEVVWIDFFFNLYSKLEKTISCKPQTAKCRLKSRRILKSLSHIPQKIEVPWHYGENSQAFSINSHQSIQNTDRYWEVCLGAAGILAYVCQSPNTPPSAAASLSCFKEKGKNPNPSTNKSTNELWSTTAKTINHVVHIKGKEILTGSYELPLLYCVVTSPDTR